VQTIENIVLIGAGNVAFHLGKVLLANGKDVLQVYSQSEKSASSLAKILDTDYAIAIEDLNSSADLYIIAVSDDAILSIAEKFKLKDKFIVHTSGSVEMDVLASATSNYGVFYPLQTFSKLREINFKEVPICLEANSLQNLELLSNLGNKLSENISKIDSAQRKILHLAAVFACNFPNLMYSSAEILLKEKNLSFDLLKPLITETAEKVQHIFPAEAQTGPAYRNDMKIMAKHIEMLKDHKHLEEIYLMLSRVIIKKQQ